MGLEECLRSVWKRSLAEAIIRPLLHLYYDIRVSGVEAFESIPKPYIVACNHAQLADGFLLGTIVPNLDFALAREECWLNPWQRPFIAAFGGIPTVRSQKLAGMKAKYSDTYDTFIDEKGNFRYEEYIPQTCKNALLRDMGSRLPHAHAITENLKEPLLETQLTPVIFGQYVLLNNRNLMIFPQGTRHPDESLNGAKHGMAKIVLELAHYYQKCIPIIPCGLRYESGRFRNPVYVTFGKPHTVIPYLAPYQFDPSRARQILTQDVMNDIERLRKG